LVAEPILRGQRQRKKINHLCVLRVSAVKYFPFDFHRFEAKLRW
jgi:hypothetical protein